MKKQYTHVGNVEDEETSVIKCRLGEQSDRSPLGGFLDSRDGEPDSIRMRVDGDASGLLAL